MNPKISVIIPVFNVEQYLRRCLDSVVNQTFRNIEIICINDGSTDRSAAILEEYAKKDNRIQIITKENGGLNSARNAGLDRVAGDYFAFIDSDDWLDATAYEKAYFRAKESGSDMTQFYFNLVDFGYAKNPPVASCSEITEQTHKIQVAGNNWSICWCYLWKTDFVKKNQLYFHNELLSNTEVPFTYKAAILANKIAIVQERLYYYFYRNTSLTGDTKSSRFLQRPLAFTLLFQDIAHCSVSEESRLTLYRYKWENLFRTYYYIIDIQLRPKMRYNIKQSITNEDIQFMKNNESLLSPKIITFFDWIMLSME